MTVTQLEILQECQTAGIKDRLAKFNQYDDGVFNYQVLMDDGLVHGFDFCVNDKALLTVKVKVSDLVLSENVCYLKHTVVLNGKIIGGKHYYKSSKSIGEIKSELKISKESAYLIQINTELTKQNGLLLKELFKDK